MPYSLTTKIGSFHFHSARSDDDSTDKVDSKNHSVGKTPFESISKLATIEKQHAKLDTNLTAARHVRLNLSPSDPTTLAANTPLHQQSVNRGYITCIKQLKTDAKKRQDHLSGIRD